MNKKIAVYPGSFDPFTKGHASLVHQAIDIFDKVIILIAKNPKKSGLFTYGERVDLIWASLESEKMNLEKVVVDLLSEGCMTVDFMKLRGAKVLLRSMRSTTEFEQEILMAHHNRRQAPDIKTIFLVPQLELEIVSSSAVREMASIGGDISYMVYKPVAKALREKFKK